VVEATERIPILVVGDARVRTHVRRILEPRTRGLAIIEAADADEAIARIDASPVRIAIVDLPTVLTRHLEVLRRVHDARPDLPILALGALPEAPYGGPARRAGAIGYVWELDLPDALVHMVEMVIEAFLLDR
jgi:DNA-binding NarL/FixJ family response regulator